MSRECASAQAAVANTWNAQTRASPRAKEPSGFAASIQKLKEEARQLLETSRRLDDEVLKRVESVEKKGWNF
jgi:hypothetical protein